MKIVICFVSAILIIIASCEREDPSKLTMTPEEWWQSMSDDWIDCLLNSSSTSNDTIIVDPKYLQEKITYINCNGYKFRDLEPVKYIVNLEYIICNDSTLVDITALSFLTKLKILYLGGTNIIEINSLSNSTEIEELYINYTKVKNIDVVERFSKLQKLQFSGTNIDNIHSLTEIKSITQLIFDSTPVSTIEPIMEHEKIKWLRCWLTNVPEEEVDMFKLLHPDCIVDY